MHDNINTFVGQLQDDHYTVLARGTEEFYLTHLKCRNSLIPIVMSNYFFEVYKNKRVVCKAFPRETRKSVSGVRGVFSYLSCIHVEETGDDQDTAYVEIEGRVVASRGLKLLDNNVSQMQFELECLVNFNKPVKVLVPCCAFSATARKMLCVEKGDRLKLAGYVSGKDDTIYVVVNRFEKEVEKDVIEA